MACISAGRACRQVAIIPGRKFEQELQLNLRVVRVGEKSFSFEVDFLLQGKPIALGKITSVCCTLEPGGHAFHSDTRRASKLI